MVTVVRDDGRDITAEPARSTFDAVPCTAHTMQVVINSPNITNVISTSKKIVESFKHSSKNTKMLKTFQRKLILPKHAMIQDEPTRWNTTYYSTYVGHCYNRKKQLYLSRQRAMSG